MMDGASIDFHRVEQHHRAIHGRLENWGSWCNGSEPRGTSPMFRLCIGGAQPREPYGLVTGNRVDRLDAAKIAEAVALLPAPHRAAINWCYVKPVSPRRMARELGTNLLGLALYLRDGRQMLLNRSS